MFACTAAALAAAAEAEAAQGSVDLPELARRHAVGVDELRAWLEYLGLGPGGPTTIDSCFQTQLEKPSTYDFIQGWGSSDTPLVLANASNEHVRIPGNMKPHSVAVHPSPTLRAVVGWRSPVAASLHIETKIQHAHPECGNGVEWALELRRGAQRRLLATGFAQGGNIEEPAAIESLAVRPGDIVALSIGARDGNHSCDLTAVDLLLRSADAGGLTWDLGADCSPDLLAANPHADRLGHGGVWNFYTEPDAGGSAAEAVVPPNSLLAKWQGATSAEQRTQCAAALQQLLLQGAPAAADSPDATLYRQLASLSGPLLAQSTVPPATAAAATPEGLDWGLDAARFGTDLDQQPIDSASLSMRAPSMLEIKLPSELVRGCEFVTTGALDPRAGVEGSVQLQALFEKPAHDSALLPSTMTVSDANGMWTSNNRRIAYAVPVVVCDGSAAQQRMSQAFDEFRELFPTALCYTKIVPVDEAVTLTQYYREDDQLIRLMLDATQTRELNRLWDELHFVAQDALTQVDLFEQLYQFATQDADPKVFEPLREPTRLAAVAFRQRLADSEPKQLAAALEFAGRAWRRPLASGEQDELRALYRQLRDAELPHEDALRLTLARVLVAPAFLYHRELPRPGAAASAVNDWELASRLSYFLWSSVPDAELRAAAADGSLHHDEQLLAQTRRMLRDPRMRRLGTEFGCAWLHIYGFDELGEKSERFFPSFNGLRSEMYEESIQFLSDLFLQNAPVLELLDADYTFLDEALAAHYGIPGVHGPDWRRVDGVKSYSRGGILGLATTLAQQSGASRTSPILRGNWLCEALLGEKLPRPPKNIPKLPEDEMTETLSVRQLVEKHSSNPACVRCHERMDAFGFALEGFDAIGRRRTQDLGGRAVDTRAKTMDGAEFEDLDGLRHYLLTKRRDAFLAQFSKKLLGYALGRAVQLSDRPLLHAITAGLLTDKSHMNDVVEAIVLSSQFRDIRGRDWADED